jgi:hypothetical protein
MQPGTLTQPHSMFCSHTDPSVKYNSAAWEVWDLDTRPAYTLLQDDV